MSALDDHPDEHFTTNSPDGHLSFAELFLVGAATMGQLIWSAIMSILRLPLLMFDLFAMVVGE